jgi:hypothetical protein
MLSTGVVSLLDVESCSSCASAGSKAARLSGIANASDARRRGAKTTRMVETVSIGVAITWVWNVDAFVECSAGAESWER